MKTTFKILKFSYPYYGLMILNTFFNFLSVIFSLFSISLVIPILGLLFGTIEPPENTVTELNSLNFTDYLYSYIYSLLDNNGALSALGFICLLVAIGTILKNSTRYLALYFLTPIRNNVIRDIRKEMYSNILRMPLKLSYKFKKGDLVARMTNDLTEIEWSIMGVLEFFIKEPMHIIIFLLSLIYISPELTLISCIFLPVGALIITSVSKSLKQNSLLSQNKMGDLISIIEESISNLKIIKAFKAAIFTSRVFHAENENLKNINNHVLWRKDLASPLSEMLSTLVMVVIIWFGGKIVLTSELKPDAFIGFLVIFSQILPPVKSLTTAYYSIKKGSAAAERVLRLLNNNYNQKINLPSTKYFKQEIVFKDVFFKYNEDLNIKNINMHISKGSKVAIVGESGSGKSTLMELLLKFYVCEKGEIIVDGNNINNIDCQSLFSVATQDVMLFNETIKHNLIIGNNHASIREIEQAARDANIHTFISKLENGYYSILKDQGNNLSGGEKQRIGIARALLSKSPILILDEPTSSLDAESQKNIKNTLNNIDNSKTLIVITHKLKSIEDSDKIIVMKNGEIVEEGNHNMLINKNGEYKKLYDIETLKSNEKN
ncbi:MAG: antibiotic ABC transporter ATP-binding protein [Flavobacteriales bacterium]|nr:antibiotic ABC transporter ATP-binding protein [Flavobacteriales bacterium]|tara:strand:- start:3353 stop:5164 length:1812 start_codon:yes stop_codon:yes gene_type:complete